MTVIKGTAVMEEGDRAGKNVGRKLKKRERRKLAWRSIKRTRENGVGRKKLEQNGEREGRRLCEDIGKKTNKRIIVKRDS